MPWDSPDVTSSILLNIVGGFLAGIALLLLQFGWKFVDKRLNRKAAVRSLRRFLQVWEKESQENAVNEEFQFVAHELRIRRMNENIEILRPHLSGGQATDIAGLVRDLEELIEARRRLVLEQMEPRPPEHLLLLPAEYDEFFAKAKDINWLKL